MDRQPDSDAEDGSYAGVDADAASDSLIERFVRKPIRRLLLEGISTPHEIALTLALGNTVGINPIYGTTTTISTLLALKFGLNLPLIQVGNWMVWPIQLAMILPFAQAGAWLYRQPGLPLERDALLEIYRAGPLAVVEQLGWSMLHAFTVWLLAATIVFPLLYRLYSKLVRQVSSSMG